MLKTPGNVYALHLYANIYATIQTQSNSVRQRSVVLRIAGRLVQKQNCVLEAKKKVSVVSSVR